MIIYGLTHPLWNVSEDTVFYVGLTKRTALARLGEHITVAGTGGTERHEVFIRETWEATGILPSVITLASVLPSFNPFEVELQLIRCRSETLLNGIGTDYFRQIMIEVAQRVLRTPRARENCSAGQKRRFASTEAREAHAASVTGSRVGYSHAPEVIERIRQFNLGKVVSDETRARQSAAATAAWVRRRATQQSS